MPSAGDHVTEILEEGDIFFFFRPVVGEDDPAGLADVQRFFLVLRPEGGKKLRLLVVGRKRLPDVPGHERVWGFVDIVTSSATRIERELRETSYETKTRGLRRRPAARPAGEGVYAITLTEGQMHLVYGLELPRTPAEVQRTFNIEPEASFALSVKNPEAGSPPGAGLNENQEADYPERLQREFRGRRFAREDVRLLDYEGAEFILVGARKDPERAYGIEIETEAEDRRRADILGDLKLRRGEHPLKPLFEGRWA